MDFSFFEEQEILRDSVRRFVRENYELEDRRKIMALKEGFSQDHWRRFAELGWLMLPFAEDDGGIGGGVVDTMIIMEEFGRGLVLEPYVADIVLAGGALRHAASVEQKENLLPDLMEGRLHISLAFAEPQGRYNLADTATMAVNEGDDYVLNGHKAIVLNGPAANQLIVTARTSGNQRDADGIT
ncbi:MAG: acyl-CoA/acyl-ACP dehydrogenase, partial [Fimbriimonadaceae bacterium]|nr:acyl-CoA/acyl-ACP dehydrogenase [Alphaproteobacteria bacterium]